MLATFYPLVQTTLQTKQQSVVAQPRNIHHLLIDEDRVHDPANFDQLLPITAVTREARYLTCRYSAHLAQTNLRDHAFKSRSYSGTGCRTSQIFIDDLNLLPTQTAQ